MQMLCSEQDIGVHINSLSVFNHQKLRTLTTPSLTCWVFSCAGGCHSSHVVNTDSLRFLCGQSVRQLSKQHGGLDFKNTYLIKQFSIENWITAAGNDI